MNHVFGNISVISAYPSVSDKVDMGRLPSFVGGRLLLWLSLFDKPLFEMLRFLELLVLLWKAAKASKGELGLLFSESW